MWLRTFVWTFVSSSRMHSSVSSSWWCSSTTRTGGVASTASTSPSTAPAWIPGQRWGGAPNILLLAPYYHCCSGRPLWSPWCPGCRSSCSSWTLSTSPATSTSTASWRRRGETTQVFKLWRVSLQPLNNPPSALNETDMRKERTRNLLPAKVGVYGIIIFVAHFVLWQLAFALKVSQYTNWVSDITNIVTTKITRAGKEPSRNLYIH